jgi:hypothetical protein
VLNPERRDPAKRHPKVSFREFRSQINGFEAKRQLTADLKRLQRFDQDPQPQRQGQAGPHRKPLRQGTALPHLLRQCRTRRRLAEGLRRRPRLPLGQAGRPELPRSDLRHPDRGGRRGRPTVDLVPPQPGLISSTEDPATQAGFLLAMEKPEPGIEPAPGFRAPIRAGDILLSSSEDAMALRTPQGRAVPPKCSRISAPPLAGSAGRCRGP